MRAVLLTGSLVVGTVMIAGACSSYEEAPADPRFDASTTDDAAPADASRDPSSDGSADGANGVPDAATDPTDATTDGYADAGPPPPCASNGVSFTCSAPANGRLTAGSCDGSDGAASCCRCTCNNNAISSCSTASTSCIDPMPSCLSD